MGTRGTIKHGKQRHSLGMIGDMIISEDLLDSLISATDMQEENWYVEERSKQLAVTDALTADLVRVFQARALSISPDVRERIDTQRGQCEGNPLPSRDDTRIRFAQQEARAIITCAADGCGFAMTWEPDIGESDEQRQTRARDFASGMEEHWSGCPLRPEKCSYCGLVAAKGDIDTVRHLHRCTATSPHSAVLPLHGSCYWYTLGNLHNDDLEEVPHPHSNDDRILLDPADVTLCLLYTSDAADE